MFFTLVAILIIDEFHGIMMTISNLWGLKSQYASQKNHLRHELTTDIYWNLPKIVKNLKLSFKLVIIGKKQRNYLTLTIWNNLINFRNNQDCACFFNSQQIKEQRSQDHLQKISYSNHQILHWSNNWTYPLSTKNSQPEPNFSGAKKRTGNPDSCRGKQQTIRAS